MIWTTVSSRSYFCWLYRASPSLATKNVIRFRYWPFGDVHVATCLLCCWKACLLGPVCSLGRILLAFALLHFVLQDQTCLLLRVFLDFLLLHSPVMNRTFFFMWVLGSLVVFIELFSFFSVSGQGIDLNYHDIEWFDLETNRYHSVIFVIAPKYCILDSCWLWGIFLIVGILAYIVGKLHSRDSCSQ